MKTPIRKSVPHFQDSVPHFQDSVPHFRTECQFPSFDLSGPGWSWSILVGPDWPWLVSGHSGLVLEGIGTPGTPWNALKHLVQSCPEMWDTMDLNWCPTFQDLVYPMVYLCNNIPSPPGYHTSLFIPRMASSDLWNHKGNLIGHSSIYIAFASVFYLFKSATNSNPTSAILSGTF